MSQPLLLGHTLYRINEHYNYIQRTASSTEERNHAYMQMYELLNDQIVMESKFPIPRGIVTDYERNEDDVYFKIGEVWMYVKTNIFPLHQCYITDCYVHNGITHLIVQDGSIRKKYEFEYELKIIEDLSCIPTKQALY
jgi:hypothetical protein